MLLFILIDKSILGIDLQDLRIYISLIKMAAIIAQMTLAARRRKEKGKGYLSGDKSNYILKPFDPVFEAKKHNLFRLKRQHYEYKREIKAKAKGKIATFCQ